MIREALIKWAVSAMLVAQPAKVTPWADTYQSTAEVFATVAADSPLFGGDDGVQRTMSWFISTAWFEGRFDPKAKGDGGCLKMGPDNKCLVKGPPQSFCMFQIGKSNFDHLKTNEEEILRSVETCTRSAVTMMKASIKLCRNRPQDEWLSQYASGGGECGREMPDGKRAGLRESQHRVNKAKWLFTNVKSQE